MSKIKVDIIEDSSGNQMRFPSAALSDGYLGVSSSGDISSVTIPKTTTELTIYDATISGDGGQTLHIERTLSADIKAKMLAGKQCTIVASGVHKTGLGVALANSTLSPTVWQNGGFMWTHKVEQSTTFDYSNSTQYMSAASQNTASSTGATWDHTGGFILNFRIVINSSEETRPTLDYEVISSTTTTARVDENTSIQTSDGRLGMLDEFDRIYIPNCRVSTNAIIKLYIFED